MTSSLLALSASVPPPRPQHPLAIRPQRIIWVIVLIGWLAAFGWNAEQIGSLLLFFTAAPHPQGDQ
ncbi:hypothetical protein [Catenulispora subtropica]